MSTTYLSELRQFTNDDVPHFELITGATEGPLGLVCTEIIPQQVETHEVRLHSVRDIGTSALVGFNADFSNVITPSRRQAENFVKWLAVEGVDSTTIEVAKSAYRDGQRVGIMVPIIFENEGRTQEITRHIDRRVQELLSDNHKIILNSIRRLTGIEDEYVKNLRIAYVMNHYEEEVGELDDEAFWTELNGVDTEKKSLAEPKDHQFLRVLAMRAAWVARYPEDDASVFDVFEQWGYVGDTYAKVAQAEEAQRDTIGFASKDRIKAAIAFLRQASIARDNGDILLAERTYVKAQTAALETDSFEKAKLYNEVLQQ